MSDYQLLIFLHGVTDTLCCICLLGTRLFKCPRPSISSSLTKHLGEGNWPFSCLSSTEALSHPIAAVKESYNKVVDMTLVCLRY